MTIEEFQRADIRIGKIASAERVEGSEKLLKLQVDIGLSSPEAGSSETSPLPQGSSRASEIRQILAGIAKVHAPEELIGKEVVIIANLEPRMLMGMESRGMLLAAHGENGEPVLLMPEREVPSGSKIS